MRSLFSILTRVCKLAAQGSALRRRSSGCALGSLVLIAGVLMLVAPSDLYAKKYRSIATGNWSAFATTWQQSTAGGVWVAATAAPGAVGDTVQINVPHTVTLDANIATSVDSLSVAGSFTVGAFNITVTGNTGVSGTLSFSSATGTRLFTGLVTVNAGGTWTNTAANSPVTFRGGITNSATFNAGTGLHTFNTNAQALNGTLAIPNITITTIVVTNNGTLTVATALAGSGGLTNAATGYLHLDFTGAVGITTLTATAAGNTVDYGFAGTQTVKVNTYHHLVLSTSGAKTFAVTTVNGNLSLTGTASATTGAALTIGGNLSIGDGTTFTPAAFNITVTGTTTVGGGTSGALTISSATGTKIFTGLVTISAGGTWTNTAANEAVTFRGGITNNGTFNAGTGVHTFDTNAQALNGTLSIANVTVTTITLTNSGTLTATTTLSGTGGLTNAATGTLNITAASAIATLTATASGNTVNYNGAAQTVHINDYSNLTFSGSAAKTLNAGITSIGGNLTFAGTATATGLVGLTIGGTVTLGAGTTFTSGAFTHNVAGDWTNNGGTFTAGTGTVNFNGTSAQNINGTAATQTFNNLTIASAGGVTVGGSTTTLTLSGAMTLASGTFTAGTATAINVATNWTNNGGTFTPGAGTVTFTGNSSAINGTAASQTFNNLTVNKTAGQTLSVGGSTTSLTVSGAFTETLGNFTAPATFDVNGNVTLTAGTFTAGAAMTVGGNWSKATAEVFTPGTGTVTFDGASAQTINGTSVTQTFNNVTINSAGGVTVGGSTTTLTLNSDMTLTSGTFTAGTATTINVASDWTNNGGTFTPGAGTVIFNGGSAQNINGTAASQTFNNLTVNGAGGVTVGGSTTLLTVSGAFTETTGNFTAPATFDVNGNVTLTAGTFTAGATMTVGGNWSKATAEVFTPGTGTVTFDGAAAQAINGTSVTQTFNNLTINGAGGVTVGGSTTTLNVKNFTETLGNFTLPAASTMNVSGDWSRAAGTFTPSTSTVVFNGTTQQITGAAATTFNNLTISTGTTTANTAPTISATFTLSAGVRYIHTTATAVPGVTRTFNATSTYEFQNSGATIANATYGNVTINIPSGAMNAAGLLQTVAGTLRIQDTGTGSFALGSTQTFTTNITGNIQVDAGTFNFSTGTGVPTVNVTGSVLLNGGTLQPATSTGLPLFNVAGDWTNNGGTFTPGTGAVNFNSTTAAQAINGTAATQTFNNITVAKTAQILSVGGSTTTLTMNGGLTLTTGTFQAGTASAINVGGNWSQATGTTFSPGSGIVTFNGSGAQNITGTLATKTFNNLTVNKSAGTLTSTASTTAITIGGTMTLTSGTFSAGTATNINVAGDWSVATGTTFTPGAGTVTLNGSGAQNITGTLATQSFNNLTLSNTSVAVSVNSNISVGNTLTVNANAILSPAAAVVVGGAGTLTGSGTVQVTRTAATPDFLTQYTIATADPIGPTVDYTSTSAQTISAVDYGNLTISGNRGANSVTLPNGGTIGVAGTFSPNASFSGGDYIKTNSTINYNGSSGQTATAFTYEYLSISNTAGVGMGGHVTVDSVLTLATGTFTIGANTLTLNGGPISVVGGTLASGATSNLEMNGGTYESTYIPSSITTLNNLLINASPTSNKITHSGALTLSGILTLTNGIFDNMPSSSDTLFLQSTASVNRIGGRVRGAIRRWVPTGSPSVYYPVGGNDLITPVTLNFNNVTIAGWVTVRMYFGDHGSIGTSGIDPSLSVNRNYSLFPNGVTATSMDATIGFGGVPPDDMDAGTTPANFIVRGYDGSNWFKTTAGVRTDTSTQATGLAINLTKTYQVGEQLVKTWDGGASTSNWGDAANWSPDGVPTSLEDVSISSGSTVNINVVASTNSLTLSNGSAILTILSGNSLAVSGNLSIVSGTFNTQASFPTVTGTTTISGGTFGYTASSGSQTVVVQSYNNLTISGGGTKTLAGTITPTGDLTISGGVFDLASNTVNRSSTGGTLTLASGATLKIGGTNTFPSNYSAHSIGSTSTVEYSGSAQAVGVLNSSQSYGHLTFSGSGTKTFPSGTTGISGDLTNSVTIDAITNSTTIDFNGGVAQAVAAANFYNLTFSNAGVKTFASSTSRIKNVFTISGTASANATTNSSTIEYNGTSAQVARAFTYYNLTVNNAAGVSIPGNVTVNNILALTSGNVTTNANTLTIASTGNISRTSGYVIGILARTVSASALTPTFEIGDATAYTPVSFSFASVTVAGTLTVSTTPGDHFQIVTSGVNSSKSVNRYWTVTNTGISFANYTAGFKFVAGDIDGGANTAAFIVAQYNGSSWALPTVGAKGTDSTQATNLTSFGDFQIGEAATGGIKTWDGGAGTNNWGDAANWNPDGVPLSTDDVNLNGANTININTAAVCNSITLNNVGLTLSVQTGSLTVSGNLTLTNGVLNVSTSAFPSVSGTVSITGGTVAYNGASGSQTISALNYNNLTLSGAATKTVAGGTTGIAGNFLVSGGSVDATSNSTTVNFNGSGSQAVAAIDYYNLTLSSSGTRTFATGTTGIFNTFSITGGSTDATSNSPTIDYKGSGAQNVSAINYYNLNLSTSGVKTFAAGTSGIANALTISGATANATTNSPTIDFNGGGAQNVNALSYTHLTLSNAGTKTFASGTTNIAGDFTLSGSATGNGTTNSTTININGSGAQSVAAIGYNLLNFSGGNTKTFGTGTATIAADFTIAGGTTGNATTNSTTIDFSGSGAQAVPAMNYYNLTLSNAGSKTLATGTTGVANTFTISGTASLDATANTTTVDINGGGAQSIPAAGYYNLTVSNAGTKTFASGTTTIAGNFTVSGGATANGTTNSTTINFNGGGAQAVGAINYFNITFSNAGTKTFATGTSRIAGAFSITGSASADVSSNTPTIEYNGSSSQSVLALTYKNLSINNATGVTIAGNVSVDGTLTFTSGTVTTNSYRVTVSTTGTVTRTSGHVFGNFEKYIPTIVPTRTFEVGDASSYTPVTVAFGSVSTGGYLTVKSTSSDHPNIATATIDPTLTANRYWTLTGGPASFTNYSITLNFVAGDVDGGAVPTNFIVGRYNGSSWSYPTLGTRTSTSTQATGLTLFGDFQLGEQTGTTQTWVGSSGDLLWNTPANWSNGTVPITTDNINLTVDSSIAVNTAAVCKNLTMNSSGLILTVATGNSLTLSGNFTMTNGTLITQVGFPAVTGSVTLNGGTVEYSASGGQTISAQTYNKLTLSGSGNKSAGGNITVNDSLQLMGSAVFDAGTSRTHTLKGQVVVNTSAGTPFIYTTANTMNFNAPGTPASRSLAGTTSATIAFDAVNVNNTSGFSTSLNFSAAGTMTVANNVVLTPGASNVISGSGTLTGNGTVQVTRTAATADFASQYTITNKTLTNLTVEYAASGQVLTNTTYGGLKVSGSIASTTNSATVGGAFTVTGTFTQTGGTMTMNNGASIVNSGTLTMNNLAIAASATVTTSSSFGVSGALTVGSSAVFNPSAGTITLNNGSSISNSGTLTFSGLTIANSATVTTSSNFTVSGALSVGSSAVFSPSAGTITLNNGASISNSATLTFSGLTIANSATVTTSSSFTVGGALTVGSSAVFSPSAGTVTMNTGSSIANSGTLAFTNLTTASGASVSASGAFTISGNLTLVGAATLTSSGNISVNGNVTNSNSIAGAGTVILTGGGSAHTVSGGGTFTNLQMNDALGATFSSNITVSGTLTLTSGIIATSSNTLTIGASGTISRTSGHISGILTKTVPTGTPTPTFEIGDATNYTPVSLSFASVTVAGTLTAHTTASDDPNIGSSTISAANSANRYWTLTNTGISFTNASLTFTFVPGDVDGGADPLQFIVGQYASGWTYPAVGTRTSTSTQATGVTTFGEFQLGMSSGGTRVSNASGNWSSTSTWTSGVVPALDDSVVIGSGHTVTIDVNTATIRSVTISNTAVLTGGGSFTLTMGAGTGGTDLLNDGTFTANSVTVKLNKNSQWNGTGAFNLKSIDFNSNTLTLAFAGANTVKLSGTGDPMLNPGTLVPGTTSTIEYNGSNGQDISSSASINFNSLKITNSAAVTLHKNLTASNLTKDLTITGGGVLSTADGTGGYSITGNGGGTTLTVDASSTLNVGGASSTASAFPTGFGSVTLNTGSTIQYSNSSSASQTVAAGASYDNILLSGSGTKTLGTGSFTITGNWTNNSTGGSLNAGSSTVALNGTSKSIAGTSGTTFATLNIGGTYTNNATTAVTAALGGSGSLTQAASSTLNLSFTGAIGITTLVASSSGNTVNYQASGAQTVRPIQYANLTLSGSGTKTLQGGSTLVSENLIVSGATIDATTNSSTVDFNGSGAQTVAATNYYNLSLSNANTKSFPAATTHIGGSLTLGGTATADATTLLSTIEFNGTSSQNFAGITYYNLNTSGAGTKTATQAVTVNNNFNNAATTDMSTFALNVTGSKTNSGLIQFGGTTNGLAFSGGTVEYNGTSSQTVATGSYNNLTISGNKGGGTVTLGSGTVGVAGALSVTASNASYTTTGNTIDFNGSGAQSVGAFNYNNLTISGSKGSQTVTLASGTVGVAGSFSPTATSVTYSTTGNTFDFNGTGAQSVGAFNYNNLTISGNKGSQTVTLASGTVGVAGTFSVTASNVSYSTTGNTFDFNGSGAQTVGAFSYNNLTISGNKGAQTVTLASGTVGVAGTFSPTATSVTYSTTGNTFDFNGTGAQTVGAFNYNDLTISGNKGSQTITLASGTVGVAGAFSVTATNANYAITGNTFDFNGAGVQSVGAFNYNNLTISGNKGAQTVTLASGTVGVAGAFSVTATNASYATTGNTVDFNGAGSQAVGGINYNNLTFSVGGTKTLSGNASLTGDLTLSAGTFDLATFTSDRSSAGGTLTISNGTSLRVGGTGSLPANFSTHSIGATSTVEFYGASQSVPALNSSQHYGILTLSGSSTKTASGALTIDGAFTNSVTTSMGTYVLTLNGTKTNSGTMQFAGQTNGLLFTDGTVEYDGTAAQAPAGQTIALGVYNNLVLTNDGVKSVTGGTVRTQSSLTVGSGISVTVSGTGTLNVDLDLTLIGSFTNNGIVNVGN